jgi:hypothetical protein
MLTTAAAQYSALRSALCAAFMALIPRTGPAWVHAVDLGVDRRARRCPLPIRGGARSALVSEADVRAATETPVDRSS